MNNNFTDSLIARLPYVFGSEIDYLRELGKSLTKDSKVLMLGIGPGLMALLLHEATEENIPVYRIDENGLKSLFEFHAVDNSDVSSYIKHMEAIGFQPGVIWQGNTDDMHSRFYDNYFDLIIIDACHTYECVKKDIEHYWPKLKYGGYMLLHDFVKMEENNGVAEAIAESITEDWVEIGRPGISIVYRKGK